MIFRKPTIHDYPFTFDTLFHTFDGMDREGSCAFAGRCFLWMAHNYQNDNWMWTRAANAFLRCGDVANCIKWIHPVNQIMPTPATLLIEARAWVRAGWYHLAICFYKWAGLIIEGEM